MLKISKLYYGFEIFPTLAGLCHISTKVGRNHSFMSPDKYKTTLIRDPQSCRFVWFLLSAGVGGSGCGAGGFMGAYEHNSATL